MRRLLVICLGAVAAGVAAAEGIRVSCICPGMVDTPASRRSRERMSAQERAALPAVIEAADVGALIVELLADEGAAGRVVIWDSRDAAPRAI